MSLSAGNRLGPYEITALLGAGGMGEVYRARDTRLDRTVAIKVLPSHVADWPEFNDRFEREARTVAALNHPHICALYDVGHQDASTGSGQATAFLVMEYLDGETLEARLKRGALPLEQALDVAIQIADALAAAHRAGVVHRDLKPGNIMLTKAGAKLLDFGLAKTAGPAKAGPYVHGVVGNAPGAVGAGCSQPGPTMLPTPPPALTAQGTILFEELRRLVPKP